MIKVLEEFGIHDKMRSLIREALTNTRSKIIFLGDQSEPFEIKTGVRQRDGLISLNNSLKQFCSTVF